MACITWTLLGCFVISTVKASQLVVPSHVVRQGEVEADVGDRVLLRCLGGSLGWEGGEDGRYEEVEEAGSATSITIPAAKAEDTGLFTCGRAELGEEVDSLYLWVEDPSKLFRNPSPMLVVNVEVRILFKQGKIYSDKSCWSPFLLLEKPRLGQRWQLAAGPLRREPL